MNEQTEPMRLLRIELQLDTERSATLAEIQREKESGAEALVSEIIAGGRPDFGRSRVRELREKLERIDELEVSVRRKRITSIRNARDERADELEREAHNLDMAAARVRAEVAPLLEKLGAIEGIEFDASILLAQRAGSWIPASGEALTDCHPYACYPDVGQAGGSFATPRHRQLQLQARELRDKAEALRKAPIRTSGQIAGSVEEIVEQIANQPEAIHPPVATVRAFAAAHDGKAQRKAREFAGSVQRPDGLFGYSAPHLSIYWDHDTIDEARSTVEVTVLSRPVPSQSGAVLGLIRAEADGSHSPGFLAGRVGPGSPVPSGKDPQ